MGSHTIQLGQVVHKIHGTSSNLFGKVLLHRVGHIRKSKHKIAIHHGFGWI